jgi:pimeloyl-ACP methyl ester carboxylesterase
MSDVPSEVKTLLFAQHGWADSNRAMLRFGQDVASPDTLVIAPNLGYVRTWLRLDPLIQQAERAAAEILTRHPDARIRVVGHSMGGLIWLELLARHPAWLARTDRLVLVGCPVGGASLARFFDPFGLTIGRDLRIDRRALAEAVTGSVPTLSIVGDLLGPHDGTISHESARLEHARFVVAPASSHASSRGNRWVTLLTRAFFEEPAPGATDLPALIAQIRAVPDIRPAEAQWFRLARVAVMFADGATIRLFDIMPGLELIFVADAEGRCVYAGGTPWPRRRVLRRAIHALVADHHAALLHPAPPEQRTVE